MILRRALVSPPVLISLIVVLLAATLPLYVSGYVLGLLTIAYYFGVFSMAWDLLFGFANEVNFGPSFLIGLGAYTAGILDNLYQPPIALCVAAGVLAAMTGGIVLALPALRVRGPYFGLTTLVAVLMLQNFVVVAAGLTGGEIGLTVPDVISIDDKVNYWISLGFMSFSSCAPIMCRVIGVSGTCSETISDVRSSSSNNANRTPRSSARSSVSRTVS